MNSWRINIVLILIAIVGAAIFYRLFDLQILKYKLYKSQALGQQVGFSEVKGNRGEVFLRNSQESKGNKGEGEIKSFAVNKERWTIALKPQELEDKEAIAESLGKLIGETKQYILSKIEGKDTYTIIKKDISVETTKEIKALGLKGVYFENTPDRYYPQERMASNVIGFLGGDGTGQYGIEGFYDNILEGKTGIKEEKRGLDLIGHSNPELDLDGSDLYLTIDYNIQFEAETLLKDVKKNLDIASGQILVLNPNTGRVLAIASYPNFDPNEYSKEGNMDVFQNPAVQKIFEPGSIMKPFTMAIGINEGKISPDSTYTDSGMLKMGPATIYNYDRKKYGLQTMTGVLENSINTGAVYVQQLVSHKTFLEYIDRFGFNQKTDIDLQGEVSAKNHLIENSPDVEFATASFGQGIGVTPIQIARGFCVIANGGKLLKPYVVEKIVKGNDEKENTSQILNNQVISKQTANQVTSMLISVIENGFGKGAKIPGYYLAGKTGTAQVPYENKRGYYPDKTIQTFLGFGPALNPQFLVLVKLDDPKVPVSSASAVPVFKKLAQYIINYWQIPPDYEVTTIKKDK